MDHSRNQPPGSLRPLRANNSRSDIVARLVLPGLKAGHVSLILKVPASAALSLALLSPRETAHRVSINSRISMPRLRICVGVQSSHWAMRNSLKEPWLTPGIFSVPFFLSLKERCERAAFLATETATRFPRLSVRERFWSGENSLNEGHSAATASADICARSSF